MQHNTTDGEDCPSYRWTAAQWYDYLMRVGKKDMLEGSVNKYYPIDLFCRDKVKRKQLEKKRKEAYDQLIHYQVVNLPDEVKPKLLERVQKKELKSTLIVFSIIIVALLVAGVLIYINHKEWGYLYFGAVSVVAAIIIVLVATEHYFVDKMIRDAIVRVCSKTKSN